MAVRKFKKSGARNAMIYIYIYIKTQPAVKLLVNIILESTIQQGWETSKSCVALDVAPKVDKKGVELRMGEQRAS